MPSPSMVVRVAANIEDLRKGLTEGRTQLEVTSGGFRQLAKTAAGETAPALRLVHDATEKAVPAGKAVTETYRQFDGVLQSMGINIGPQVKGLEDIANAAGKTSTGLGALGTAGALLGAGVAGWGIGRAIADFLSLDKHVEAAWRQLLNFKSAAAETAGAVQDTINKALAMGAKEGLNYAESQKFIADAFKKSEDAAINWRGKLADAQRELRHLSDSQKAEIEIAQRAGATTEQLTNKYGLSALALKELAAQQKSTAQATEEHRKAQEALLKNFTDARSNAMKRMHAQEAADMEAAMQRRIANEEGIRRMEAEAHQMHMAEVEQRRAAEETAEAERIAANQAEIDALLSTTAAHKGAGVVTKASTDQMTQGWAQVAQQVTITGEAVKEWINLMRFTNQANAILSSGSSLFTTQSQRERVAAIGGSTFGGGGGVTVNIQSGAIQQQFPISSDRSTVEPLIAMIKKELGADFRNFVGSTPVGA